ncbi:TetR/AcrR family transcriptional regulator [Paraburkholderia sp. SIMBA_049]
MSPKASTAVSAPYHHGNLRNTLVAEGRRALEEIGVHELSLRYLARKAGVSEAAPSHHFAGKEGLLAAIAADGFRDLAALRASISVSDQTALSKAYRMMKVYVEFAQRYKGLFELMVGPRIVARDSYPELSTETSASFRLFASSIEQFALEKGWEDQSLNLVTHAAWSMEHGLATLILSDRMPRPGLSLSIDKVVEFSISMFLSAVAAGASSLEEVMQHIDALSGDSKA